MKTILHSCVDAAQQCGAPGNDAVGVNITGFVKVADAMIGQIVVWQ